MQYRPGAVQPDTSRHALLPQWHACMTCAPCVKLLAAPKLGASLPQASPIGGGQQAAACRQGERGQDRAVMAQQDLRILCLSLQQPCDIRLAGERVLRLRRPQQHVTELPLSRLVARPAG